MWNNRLCERMLTDHRDLRQSQADLLSRINHDEIIGPGQSLQIILLLTKAFTPWLSNDHDFLQQFVQKFAGASSEDLGESTALRQRFHLFTAVVDAIPGPSPPWKAYTDKQTTKGDSIASFDALTTLLPSGVSKDMGLDGLTYCASETLPILHDLDLTGVGSSAQQSSTRPDVSLSSAKPPALSFKLFHHFDNHVSCPIHHTMVSLPVASTMFINGRASTMSYSTWETVQGSITMVRYDDLPSENQTLYLPAANPFPINRARQRPYDVVEEPDSVLIQSKLVAPLHALASEPRQIANSMGNVITRVNNIDSGDVQTASQDLEMAVAEYLEAQDIKNEGLAVWALIIPRSLCEVEKDEVQEAMNSFRAAEEPATTAHMSRTSDYIARLLFKGATLRRVLSGGGGWGVKAGMLSVDPDTGYLPGAKGFESFLPSFLQTGESMMSQNVSSPGDVIMFFAAPHDDASLSVDSIKKRYLWSFKKRSRRASLDFGVTPSTVDELPPDAAAIPAIKDKSPAKYIRRHFGALSEIGMSVSQPTAPGGPHIASKIDVPFTRFSQVALQPRTTEPKTKFASAAIIGREDLESIIESGELLSLRFWTSKRFQESTPGAELFKANFPVLLKYVALDMRVLHYQLKIVKKHLQLEKMSPTIFQRSRRKLRFFLKRLQIREQDIPAILSYIHKSRSSLCPKILPPLRFIFTPRDFRIHKTVSVHTRADLQPVRFKVRRDDGDVPLRAAKANGQASIAVSNRFRRVAFPQVRTPNTIRRPYSTERSISATDSDPTKQGDHQPSLNSNVPSADRWAEWKARDPEFPILKHAPSSHDLFTKSHLPPPSKPKQIFRKMYYTKKERAICKAQRLQYPRRAGTKELGALREIRYAPADEKDSNAGQSTTSEKRGVTQTPDQRQRKRERAKKRQKRSGGFKIRRYLLDQAKKPLVTPTDTSAEDQPPATPLRRLISDHLSDHMTKDSEIEAIPSEHFLLNHNSNPLIRYHYSNVQPHPPKHPAQKHRPQQQRSDAEARANASTRFRSAEETTPVIRYYDPGLLIRYHYARLEDSENSKSSRPRRLVKHPIRVRYPRSWTLSRDGAEIRHELRRSEKSVSDSSPRISRRVRKVRVQAGRLQRQKQRRHVINARHRLASRSTQNRNHRIFCRTRKRIHSPLYRFVSSTTTTTTTSPNTNGKTLRITYEPGLGHVKQRSRMSTLYRRKLGANTSGPALRSAREQQHHRHQQGGVGDVMTINSRHGQSRQDIALARQGREGRLARWLDSSQQRSGDHAVTAISNTKHKASNAGSSPNKSPNADARKSSSDNWAVIEGIMGAVRALDRGKASD